MPALELEVASDAAVGDPAVDRRDHLHPARPVACGQRPFDTGAVGVGHAHEPAAGQPRLAAAGIAKAKRPARHRPAQVELMAVVQQLHLAEADRVLALDPQLQHQPVRQVDEVLVEHRDAPEDRRLAVVDPMGISPGVMHTVGVLPLGSAPGAEPTVSARGQNLAQTLLVGIVVVVGERERLYREVLESAVDRIGKPGSGPPGCQTAAPAPRPAPLSSEWLESIRESGLILFLLRGPSSGSGTTLAPTATRARSPAAGRRGTSRLSGVSTSMVACRCRQASVGARSLAAHLP